PITKIFSFSRTARAGKVSGILTGINLSIQSGRGEAFWRRRSLSPECFAPTLLPQRLIEIPPQVLDVFETDAEANKIGRNARAELLIRCQLAVGGARRVNGETFGIAHIGKMTKEL